MTLLDALKIVKQPCPENAAHLVVSLACGFTPLHMETFLGAWLRRNFPAVRVEIRTGLFGDLEGNLERLPDALTDAVAAVIEWPDIDPRLGIRNLGGWRATDLSDILNCAERRIVHLEQVLRCLARGVICVCSLPTQPLPPLFPHRPHQSGAMELRLRQLVAGLGAAVAESPHVRVVSAQELEETSPSRDRLNVRSEILSGFPYTLPHASALARLLADLIHDPVPKKGLITDLDDTLWSGVLGEVGVDNVSWGLEGNSLGQGLYQQLLASLASTGVLIAVATKNDAALVDRAFERKDLLLAKSQIFPFEVHWSRKSASVERILKTWHIAADSVVFVDDSAMEVAEVQAAFPEIECRLFPKNDAAALWTLLRELRALFGKSLPLEEDTLRLDSIRRSALAQDAEALAGDSPEAFLKEARGVVELCYGRTADPRSFELINKTNQFNLNGRRIGESEWIRYLSEDDSFLLSVHYEDKYGRLGKIATMLGKCQAHRLVIDFWVMSCRALSRRIEHQCLKYLFDNVGAKDLVFDYRPTERNGPLREFFAQMIGSAPLTPVVISRETFETRSPVLVHRTEERLNA
jgi:FkbH-like protein